MRTTLCVFADVVMRMITLRTTNDGDFDDEEIYVFFFFHNQNQKSGGRGHQSVAL